jgi:hypothetical protein
MAAEALPFDPRLYSNEFIQGTTAEEFQIILEQIRTQAVPILRHARGWLNECWCPSFSSGIQSYSRLWPSFLNFRVGFERKILSVVDGLPRDAEIRLLSIGSGGLFQELMLLILLARAGFKKIDLDCIEIFEHAAEQKTLTTFIEQWKLLDVHITCQYNQVLDQDTPLTEGAIGNQYKIAKIRNASVWPPSDKTYHVIYGIDIDEIQLFMVHNDFSHRALKNRSDGKNSEAYYLASLFMRAYSRLIPSAHSLFFMSYGTFSLTINQHHHKVVFPQQLCVEKNLDSQIFHDVYYIYSNFMELLYNLSFLIKQSKPIWINQEILDESNQLAIERILENHGLQYFIAPHDEIVARLSAEGKVYLVFDATVFDSLLSGLESPLESFLTQGYGQISRRDYADSIVADDISQYLPILFLKQLGVTEMGLKKAPIRAYPAYHEVTYRRFVDNWESLSDREKLTALNTTIEAYRLEQPRSYCSFFSGAQDSHYQRVSQFALEFFEKLRDPSSTMTSGIYEGIYTLIQNEPSNLSYALLKILYHQVLKDDRVLALPDSVFEGVKKITFSQRVASYAVKLPTHELQHAQFIERWQSLSDQERLRVCNETVRLYHEEYRAQRPRRFFCTGVDRAGDHYHQRVLDLERTLSQINQKQSPELNHYFFKRVYQLIQDEPRNCSYALSRLLYSVILEDPTLPDLPETVYGRMRKMTFSTR